MTAAPVLQFAFEARVDVGPEEHVGHGEGERLGFTPITGGTVAGPRLDGTILPGGGDWWTQRGETTTLEARYLIRAQDGALIDVVNRGYFRASADVEARMLAGEPVDDADVYYRTSPVFRTDAPAHAWLAGTVLVGLARMERGQVAIRFFALA